MQHISSNYEKMNVDSLIELKNLIEDYPYCQTFQILYLLNLRRLEEDTFNTRLPFTAICVGDRQQLKNQVEKIEEILAKDTQKSIQKKSKKSASLPLSSDKSTSYQSKTISDLLQLNRTAKPLTTVKIPQKSADDILLEQLRQEALAKVSERINEIRRTKIVEVNFAETAKDKKHVVSTKELIDKVIATNPKISKVDDSDLKQKTFTHWKTKEEHSLREDYKWVSETLAQLYVEQGAPKKAQEIYKTLIQKFPEKKEYFSQLSKQIKNNNHKPKTKK